MVACLVGWSFGWLVVCHGHDSSDVTLAFEDAQVIQTLMDDDFCNVLDCTGLDLTGTIVDLPDTMVDLPDTMVDLPDTMVSFPDASVDIPDTMEDLL